MPPGHKSPKASPLAGVVHRNIEALLKVREELDQQRTRAERIADGIARFIGSLTFAYVQLAIITLWLGINMGWLPIMRPFDRFPFVMLAVVVSIEAIFLSTFVLITQNRMAQMADKRAELDLQINLLAEHEVTRLIKMVEATMSHLGVPNLPEGEIAELRSDVDPEEVWQEIVKAEEEAAEGMRGDA